MEGLDKVPVQSVVDHFERSLQRMRELVVNRLGRHDKTEHDKHVYAEGVMDAIAMVNAVMIAYREVYKDVLQKAGDSAGWANAQATSEVTQQPVEEEPRERILGPGVAGH